MRADLRTSSIGATAPGGHPTMAYSPLPYVTGPQDTGRFVHDRVAEGATHLKLIYDDGSGTMLNIPSLDVPTIEALVAAAHSHGLTVAAHMSTASGAVTVARCGVDLLAHAPFDRMSDTQVSEVAETEVAVIATLSILDGFPGPDGVMPLLSQPALAQRLPPRWRRVLQHQATRWMPPEPPDGAAHGYNTLALHEAGVRVLAGTDVPNPGLVFGASLRELQHLVRAGFTPTDALVAATSLPAQIFGLVDRGVIQAGARADLLLVQGDPTADITATQDLTSVWVLGRPVDGDAYPGSAVEREGIVWQKQSTAKIVKAIEDLWPDFPTPQDVAREDGELLGRLVPTTGGWQAMTTFNAPLGTVTTHDAAIALLHARGLTCLVEPWWVRTLDDSAWREAELVEVGPDRIRLRWMDRMIDQPPSGQWFDLDDIDLTNEVPTS